MKKPMNRREHSRVPVKMLIGVVPEGGSLQEVWTKNLSVGGIASDLIPAPINSRIRVLIPLPGSIEGAPYRLYQLEGQVAWRKLSATGIQFLNTHPEAQTGLRVLMDQQASAY